MFTRQLKGEIFSASFWIEVYNKLKSNFDAVDKIIYK